MARRGHHRRKPQPASRETARKTPARAKKAPAASAERDTSGDRMVMRHMATAHPKF